MTVTLQRHLVLVVSPLWGHARPLSTLAARIVKMRDIIVTFAVVKSLHGRVEAEVARDFYPEDRHLLDKIRIIAIEDGSQPHETSGAPGAFKALWSSLCHDEPLICAKTGMRFEAPPIRPSAAFVDFFSMDAFDVVRDLSGSTVKLYVWYASALNTFFPIFGEDPVDMVRAEVERSGKQPADVVCDLFWTRKGRLLHSPCGPSMYDYETHPQESPLNGALIAHVLMKVPRLVKEVDGLVTFDAAEYQPKSTAAVQQWFERSSRRAFFTGPLVPEGDLAVANEASLSQNSDEISDFLNEKIKSHGEKSVLYIAFGSLFWPSDPAKVWAVLDVLMEKGIPFVMSHGALSAALIPEEIKAKISGYGNAIVSNWVPQQALLSHASIGWFLMHGGHNGVLEGINAGVPMIIWPISADQPLNAIYLSEEINIAYELVEVRHGTGLGKIYRNGRTPIGTVDAVKEEARAVIEKAFGADGAEKRARLQVMRKTLQAAWREDGVARRETSAFLSEI
ncbi:UDP-Glycosyltransferase/glycogen phosphorylase [Trametes gibbosa]|nr:UDP-Glycosyltransferase/glycogen phosphorylase [Trametes gibbosa]